MIVDAHAIIHVLRSSVATINEAESRGAGASASTGVMHDDIRHEEIAEATLHGDAGVPASPNIHRPPPGHRGHDQNISSAVASDPLNQNHGIPRQSLGYTPPVAVMSVDAPDTPPATAGPVRSPAIATSSRGALVRKGSNRVENGKAVRRESNPGPTKQIRPDNLYEAQTVQVLKDGTAAFRQGENAFNDQRSTSIPHSNATGQAFHGGHDVSDAIPIRQPSLVHLGSACGPQRR